MSSAKTAALVESALPWVPEGFFPYRCAEATIASDDGVVPLFFFHSPLQLRRRGSLRGFAVRTKEENSMVPRINQRTTRWKKIFN